MKTSSIATNARLLLPLLIAAFIPAFAHASAITLLASDAAGATTSFNGAGHWSNAAAPSSGNTYDTTTAFMMRTPNVAGALTFGGASLQLSGPGNTTAGGGRLDLAGTSSADVMTVGNLIVTNLGMIQHGGNGGVTLVLAGGLTIQSDSSKNMTNGCVFLNGNGPILVTASIGGSGAIDLGTPSAGANGNNIILAGSLSGFTGAILTSDHHVTVPLTVSNATAQTLSGNISMLDLFTKSGAGALTLSGSNTFSGGFTLNSSLAGSQVNINSTNALGATASTFTISGGNNGAIDNTSGAAITNLNNNPMAWNSDFTFVGSNPLNLGNGNVTLNATRTVTVSASTLTVGGIISGAGLGITKNGAGTLLFNGVNTYSNNTTVSGGTLALGASGSIANSTNIIVGSGATFDVSAASYTLGASRTLGGSGNANGNVTDSSTSTILPGGSGTVGALTFNNNLTLAGGDTLKFDFASTSNDVINIAGILTVNGTTAINLASLPPGGLVNGNYILIQATNNLSGPGGFTITGAPSPSRQTFTIVTNGTSPQQIILQVGGSPANLIWQPTSSAWDIVTTKNWLNGVSTDFYFDGDSVNFTDAGSGTSPVLNTIATPGSVTFNSANAYTLSGTGKITGGTGLTKTNSGTLTILTPTNDYSGATYIGGGTVSVTNLANGGSASPIGAASSASTSLILDGGALQYNGTTIAINRGATLNVGGGTLAVTNPAAMLTLSGVIAGTSGGGLSKTGNGTLALSGANTYNGPTTISAGTLQVTNTGSFGSGNVTNNSALWFSGNLTITNNISGTGSLTNDANGTLTLSGANTYSGATTINGPSGGGLVVASSSALGSTPSVTVVSTTGGAFGGTRVTLNAGVSTPAGTTLVLPTTGTTVRSALAAAGASSWNGPITINGDGAASPSDQLAILGNNAGALTIGGNVTGVNFPGTLQLRNGTGVVNGTLNLGAGATVQINDGVTWTINSSGNSWLISEIANGTMQLGANNAMPTLATVKFGAAGIGTLDLNGFNQQVGALIIAANTGIITNSSATADSTLTVSTNGGSSTFSGTIVDGAAHKVGLTVAGGTTLTLSGANTYSGNSTINAGTLALSGSGSIANSANIVIGSGATFNVSGLTTPPMPLGSSQTLSNSTSTGVINGSVSTGSGAVSLTYASGTPSLNLTNGTLTLAGTTTFNVNNTGATLPHGSYNIISISTGGSAGLVAGTVPSVTVTGNGVTTGATPFLQITNNALNLVVPDQAPMVGNTPVTNTSPSGLTWKIAITNLAAEANWSDPDGDQVSLASVANSANSVSVTTDGNYIYYNALVAAEDHFTYTVTDGSLTANGIVYLEVAPASTNVPPNITGITNIGGNVTISFASVPNTTNVVQWTTNLATQAWSAISTNLAGTNGLWSYTDTNPPSPSFYRSMRQP